MHRKNFNLGLDTKLNMFPKGLILQLESLLR